MKRKMKAGSTSQSVPIFVQDTSSTTGAGLGSLVYNTSGLAAKYRRKGDSSWTTITLATMTLGTWASGGFVTDGGPVTGTYELGLPDAVLASSAGVTWVEVVVYGATNMLPVLIEIELDAVDYQDATAFGLSRIDAAVSSRMATYTQPSGFLAATFPTTVASTTNITAATGVTVSAIGNDVITAASIAADAITDAKVASDVTIASVTGAVGSVTGNVGGNVVGSVASVTAGVTVTTNNDKTGYALSSAGVQAIWDALTSALTTVGSIGKRIADYLTGDAYARLGAPTGASISADIAALQSDTDNIQTRIPAALTADGNIKADTLRVNGTAQTAGDLAALITTVDDLLDTEMPALTAAVAALPTSAQNAAALLDLSNGIETSITPRQAMRLILAAAAGKLSGAATTSIVIRNVGDSKDRITATVDSSGNRSAVTVDGT